MLLSQLDRRTGTLVRLIGLVLISWSVLSATRDAPGLHGRALVVLVAFVACVAATLVWTARPADEGGLSADVLALAAAGGFLTAAAPDSASRAFAFVAVVTLGVRLELAVAAVGVVIAVLALALGTLIYTGSAVGLLAYSLGLVAALLAASTGRQSRLRAEQAEVLLAQSQRSHEEQLRSARLEESTRIARDIHDVLAHALAGLTIQLEATSALIDQGADAATIKTRVTRAQALAREGLDETRRAVGALRGDPVTAPATALAALVAEYREAAPGVRAELSIDGELDAIDPRAAIVLVRVAQESLTNVRKHAPGADVTVIVDIGAELRAVIEDRGGGGGAPADAAAILAVSGGGYGVRGMRERAEELGGRLEAGPTGDGWRVALTLPAGGTPGG